MNYEKNFTPGPWTIDNGPKTLDADHRILEIHSLNGGKTGDGNVLAIIVGDTFNHTVPFLKEANKNANLIASAPDLLEALESLLNELPAIYRIPSKDLKTISIVDKAKVAIKKAHGL